MHLYLLMFEICLWKLLEKEICIIKCPVTFRIFEKRLKEANNKTKNGTFLGSLPKEMKTLLY